MTYAHGWSVERRARQSEAIRRWRPWERSTGPVTIEGKARASQNASKGDMRKHLREIRALLRECDGRLETVLTRRDGQNSG